MNTEAKLSSLKKYILHFTNDTKITIIAKKNEFCIDLANGSISDKDILFDTIYLISI
jgi:hypothetical protein